MGENKQAAPSNLFGKKSIKIGLAVFTLIVLFFGFEYLINRPNYRDLQSEYKKLVIPADWQLVSKNDDKGVLSLFCWGIDNSSCPSISVKSTSIELRNPETDMNILKSILNSDHFTIKEENTKECTIFSDKYFCGITAYKGKYGIRVGIVQEISSSKEKRLSILLGQKSGMGL